MSSVSRAVVDRNQRVLSDLNKQPGNDICADCKAKGPRWASHNLGIFLCVQCAGIHRKIGTHVTKVKSVTMDSWSKEQVEVMKSTGNIASNSRYNPNESRHPAPGNREGSGKDDEMEKYIRAKYEFKRFMIKPQSQLSADNPNTMTRKSSPAPPPPPSSQAQPYPVSSFPQMAPTVTPQATPSSQPSMPSTAPAASVWNDLMSLSSESTQSVAPSYSGNPQTAAAVSVASPGVSPFTQMPNLSGSPFGTQAVFTRSPSISTSALSSQHSTQGLHFSQPISGQAAPFIQNTATVHPFNQPVSATGGISAASHPMLYPQQTLLQTQGHSNAFGTPQNSAPGTFHPSLYQQQVSVPNQAYAQGPYSFDPSFHLQQPPLPVQNDANYLQWQQTQAGFSSTPQSNQWTS